MAQGYNPSNSSGYPVLCYNQIMTSFEITAILSHRNLCTNLDHRKLHNDKSQHRQTLDWKTRSQLNAGSDLTLSIGFSLHFSLGSLTTNQYTQQTLTFSTSSASAAVYCRTSLVSLQRGERVNCPDLIALPILSPCSKNETEMICKGPNTEPEPLFESAYRDLGTEFLLDS